MGRFWILAWGLLLASESVYAQCSAGTATQLAASCANGWDNADRRATASDFNPWPASCEFGSEELGKARASRLRVIHSSDCSGSFKVLQIKPASHLAEVSCADQKNSPLWVSLDALQCQDNNARMQAALRSFELPSEVEANSCVVQNVSFSEWKKNPLKSSSEAVLNAFQRERLEEYRKEILQTQARIAQDMERITKKFLSSMDGARAALERATVELSALRERAIAKYGPQCVGTDGGDADLVRGQRTCRLLDATVTKAKELLEKTSDEDHLVENLSVYLQSRSAEGDFLAIRMLLFYTYSQQERRQMVESGEVVYARKSLEREIPGGQSFYELHDGYVYGGSRLGGNSGNGLDCSSFSVMNAALNGSVDAPSTLALRGIARHLLAGDKGSTSHLGSWASYRHCFDVVDLRKGQEPRAMDLVVSRSDSPDAGHVVIVENYDRTKGEILTLESKGGTANTNTRCVRPLFEQRCSFAPAVEGGVDLVVPPPPRSDLYVLRFKDESPLDSRGKPLCPLRLQ